MSFNINAKVVLSGPERLDKIRNSIKKKLGNLNVPLTIDVGKGTQSALSNLNSQTQALQKSMAALQAATKNVNKTYNRYNSSSKSASNSNKNLAQATNAVSNSFDRTAKSAKQAGNQVEKFGKDAALAIRRFSAFTLATGAVFGFVQAVRTGVSESISFERELSRITQVTGKTGNSIKRLGSEIQGLAASFGVSKKEIAEVAVILAQTGRGLDDIQKSLAPLVKTKLGPTFKDLKSTTEGLVAAQAQFGIQSKDTGKILDSLNAIAKRFAVESDDLVSVIRRAGGVFAEANKNAKLFAQGSGVAADAVSDQIQSFNELLGIFTSVRSQTRETADTISTGLRTIFSRLQRPTTIKFLEQYGVQLKVTEQDVKDFQNTTAGGLISQGQLKQLQDSVGDFVGVSEAIRRIGVAAKGLNNLELSKLVEELGGIRQVGKIIPALRNVDKAIEATNILQYKL
jgi:predicted  nucleic acid-binding Zn-ribbon protein